MSAFDLLVYDLVFIAPVAALEHLRSCLQCQSRAVPLVYVVGLVAMMFTALSYAARWPRRFRWRVRFTPMPANSIRERRLFAGWALLLDYLLLPALIYVTCAVTMHAVVRRYRNSFAVLEVRFLNTAINLLGIESTARVSILMLILRAAVTRRLCRARLDHAGAW